MAISLKKYIEKYNQMSDVAKATLWFFACNMLQKCISMITTPIFTRLLSTEQYGIYNTYVSWMQIFTIIITARLDYGVFNKGMSKYSEDKDEYVSTMQVLSSGLTLVVLMIYLIFSKYINQATGLSTFVTVAMCFEVMFTSAISFWMVRQRYDYKYKLVVGISLAIAICNTGLGILGVLLTNYSGFGRIITSILVQICFGLFIYINNIRKSKKLFVKEYAKFAILFNLPLLPHYFASYILSQFDRIMIMKLVGYSAVGIYSVAYSAGYVIKIVTSSLNNTLIPWQYRKLQEKDFSSLTRCISSIMNCVMICFMLYMALSPEIIKIFANEEYAYAIYVLPPITASAFLIFMYELYANIEFFYNANKFTMYIAITGAVINIILNYICITKWGFIWAAYTTLICYVYFAITHYIYMRYQIKKNTNCIVFNTTEMVLRIVILVVYTILVSLLFEHVLVRYLWIAIMLVYVFIQRKKLLSFISQLK